MRTGFRALIALMAGMAISLLTVPAQAQTTNTVIAVDVSQAGVLPSATATAAWSVRTNVTLTPVSSCAGPRCIHLVHVVSSACDVVGGAVGGCSGAMVGDGSCTSQVDAWLDAYPDAERAATEHELGHCLGLSHNTTDPRSIMQPTLSLSNPPKGPDSQDRANVRALFP